MSDKEVTDLTVSVATLEQMLKSQNGVLAELKLALVGDNNQNLGVVRRLDAIERRMSDSANVRKRIDGKVWAVLLLIAGAIVSAAAMKLAKML